GRRQQDCAAQACRDEALDGGAHSSLQALYRRLPCARRRGLRRGRGAQGRVRRLSRRRRHQQALQVQDQGARFRAPAGDGLPLQGSHARRRLRGARLARHRVRGGGSVSSLGTCSSLLAVLGWLAMTGAAQGQERVTANIGELLNEGFRVAAMNSGTCPSGSSTSRICLVFLLERERDYFLCSRDSLTA